MNNFLVERKVNNLALKFFVIEIISRLQSIKLVWPDNVSSE